MYGTRALVMGCARLGTLLGTLAVLGTGCTWKPTVRPIGEDGTGGYGGDMSQTGVGGTPRIDGGQRLEAGIRPDTGELSADAACNVQMYTVKSTPDLLILLDKSLSMNEDPATGTNCNTPGCSKWDQMTAAVNQVVSATPDAWWGLKFFGDVNGDTCGVGTTAAVAPAPNSAAAIASAIMMNAPSSATPTRAAVTNAGVYLRGLTDANQRFIILATDGAPTCGTTATRPDGGMGNPNFMTPDPMGAEMAVSTQASMGTKTFVIGIATASDATATTTLMNMATNGMTGQPYFPVSNSADLVTALKAIQSAAKSCTFPLGQVPSHPENIRVDGDGMKINQDTSNTNGWNYTDTKTIQLYGQACDDYVKDTIKTVSVILGCDTPIPG